VTTFILDTLLFLGGSFVAFLLYVTVDAFLSKRRQPRPKFNVGDLVSGVPGITLYQTTDDGDNRRVEFLAVASRRFIDGVWVYGVCIEGLTPTNYLMETLIVRYVSPDQYDKMRRLVEE